MKAGIGPVRKTLRAGVLGQAAEVNGRWLLPEPGSRLLVGLLVWLLLDQTEQRAKVDGVHFFAVAFFLFGLQIHRQVGEPLVVHQMAKRLQSQHPLANVVVAVDPTGQWFLAVVQVERSHDGGLLVEALVQCLGPAAMPSPAAALLQNACAPTVVDAASRTA